MFGIYRMDYGIEGVRYRRVYCTWEEVILLFSLQGFLFKGDFYIGISRFVTTDHVWYREDSGIEWVRHKMESSIEGVWLRGGSLY